MNKLWLYTRLIRISTEVRNGNKDRALQLIEEAVEKVRKDLK